MLYSVLLYNVVKMSENLQTNWLIRQRSLWFGSANGWTTRISTVSDINCPMIASAWCTTTARDWSWWRMATTFTISITKAMNCTTRSRNIRLISKRKWNWWTSFWNTWTSTWWRQAVLSRWNKVTPFPEYRTFTSGSGLKQPWWCNWPMAQCK